MRNFFRNFTRLTGVLFVLAGGLIKLLDWDFYGLNVIHFLSVGFLLLVISFVLARRF